MSTETTDQNLETTIDTALADTFPASDPPAWTLGREPHPAVPMMTGASHPQTEVRPEVTRREETSRLTILGIAGSLRRASYNRALLRAAQQLVPTNVTLDIFDIAGIPLFNQEHEKTLPIEVVEFKTRIRAADAILIATPEYNYSIPGVLKNAIDWASRPPDDNVWTGKPVAILGASIGRLGTARAQYHLRQVFVTLNMCALNQPEVMISNADKLFDATGNLTDTETHVRLQRLLDQLVLWTRQLSATHRIMMRKGGMKLKQGQSACLEKRCADRISLSKR
jgi:chromate reductase, NAD(P)H dehydrogenase (quinone)